MRVIERVKVLKRKNNDVYQLIDYQGVLAEQRGSGKVKGIKTRKNKDGLKGRFKIIGQKGV